jgi:hypothetical protein
MRLTHRAHLCINPTESEIRFPYPGLVNRVGIGLAEVMMELLSIIFDFSIFAVS